MSAQSRSQGSQARRTRRTPAGKDMAFGAGLALVVSQLGRLLPERLTTLVGVFAIGLCWIPLALFPLALFPWERFGLGGVIGGRSKPGGKPGSDKAE